MHVHFQTSLTLVNYVSFIQASDAGPFSSLQELKGHPGKPTHTHTYTHTHTHTHIPTQWCMPTPPAHLAVFLHYLYLTKDPKHLVSDFWF